MNESKATFEGIRENIVEYLSANPEFKDYNFTAPAICTLIDALAYTSHYLMRYANFSLNECFLDTAQLRSNVVSHAKELGYIPHQSSAAKASLRLTVSDVSQQLNDTRVPEGTIFIATNVSKNVSYTFRTMRPYFFERSADGKWTVDVEVVEGSFVTETFVQDEYYTNRYYLINDRVDVDYLDVIVYSSETDREGETYCRVQDVDSFFAESPIYYLYEAYNGLVEICFGDGVLSKKITPNSTIKVRYLVTNGSAANNIVNFLLPNNIGNIYNGDVSIEVLTPSENGCERESVESIRNNAPKFFQSQNRAVTTSDYNALMLNKFGGWIDSVVSWGGEEENPPQYGNVFICVRPRLTETLSISQRQEIISYLESRNLPCVDVKIVDPSYIDVIMRVDVDWNKYNTTKSRTEVINLIENTTKSFFKLNATSFASKFLYSKYLSEVNALDDSIESILTSFQLRQYFAPVDTEVSQSFSFEFHNKIERGSVLIGPWNERGQLDSIVYSIADDDEDGKLFLTVTDGYTKKRTLIGSVDYDNGVVEVGNYQFNKVRSLTQIPVVCKPLIHNLNVVKRHILRLSELNVSLNES